MIYFKQRALPSFSSSTTATSTYPITPTTGTTTTTTATTSSVISSSSSSPSSPSMSATPSSFNSLATTTSTTTTTSATTTTSTTFSTTPSTTSTSTTTSTTSTTSFTTTTTSTSSSTTSTTTTTTTTTSLSTSTSTSPSPSPSSTSTTIQTPAAQPQSSTILSLTTTFQSIHFITTTDHQGGLITSTPSILTTVLISTASNGGVVTITQVGVNQTLSPNNSTSNSKSPFFRSTGAVAGVFLLVGLAVASILLWILFAIRRRRRTQRLDHDTAVSATLAAAGFHRTLLDDDDDQPGGSHRSPFGSSDLEMIQRSSAIGTSSSAPSAGRASAYLDSTHPDDPEPFNPYIDYNPPSVAREGNPSRPNSSPPPAAFYNSPYRDRTDSGTAGDHVGHSASHSAGSYEPLLASFQQSASLSFPIQPGDPSSSRPHHSQKPSDASQPLIVLTPDSEHLPADNHVTNNSSLRYSSESVADDRLHPGLRLRLNGEDRASTRDLRDDEDYSRPVLGIRNMPDAASQNSLES